MFLTTLVCWGSQVAFARCLGKQAQSPFPCLVPKMNRLQQAQLR